MTANPMRHETTDLMVRGTLDHLVAGRVHNPRGDILVQEEQGLFKQKIEGT